MRHSLQDKPSNLTFVQNDSVTSKIMGSPQWNSQVSNMINEAQSNNLTSFTVNSSMAFTSGDLFYGLHRVSYEVTGALVDGNWNLSVTINDTFDFTYNSEKNNFFTNLANNCAYWDMELGLISPYDITITFNQTVPKKKDEE